MQLVGLLHRAEESFGNRPLSMNVPLESLNPLSKSQDSPASGHRFSQQIMWAHAAQAPVVQGEGRVLDKAADAVSVTKRVVWKW
jgi:hypothetical protein